MKKVGIQKGLQLKDDEKYLEGINLVTGDKIDYTRHILTETQVSALCVSEQMSKVQKFVLIMTQGEKIQKWSLFENITLYIQTQEAAEKIFGLLEKNYSEYHEFIAIMGEGVTKYLQSSLQTTLLINQKIYDMVYRIIFRTVTSQKFQGSEALSDWMSALTLFFRFPQSNQAVSRRKQKLSQLNDFINGSFSMNTLPDRRKTALQMINALIGESQEVQSQTHNKILFFNNDLNPSTRLVICSIIEKILCKQNSPEIWKCVTDYYFIDKSPAVKEKAFEIISKIHYQPIADNIFQEFDSEKNCSFSILVSHAAQLIKTFEREVKKEPMYQLKIFSFLNRLLRDNMEKYIGTVVESYQVLMDIVSETVLISELEFKKFNLQSMQVINSMIELSSIVVHLEFKEELKKQILKGLRYHQFYVIGTSSIMEKLIEILQLSSDEDINIFILLFSKQIQNSKWKNIMVFLDHVPEIKFYQSHLEKIVSNLIKIYSNQQMHQVIFRLLLIDRKGMEVYLKVREKCLGSKNWMLRRNFIKLYTFFKTNGSFEVNKSITPLVYKNIVNEKNALIKLQFVRQFIKAYPYLDPSLPQEKISIKEVISRFAEDRDKQLAYAARQALEFMRQIDHDYENTQELLQRNKELLRQESLVEQVLPDIRKHVKTQKLIGKSPKESRNNYKKGSLVETKTLVTLSKMNQIEKSKDLIPESKPAFVRSNSSQNKKEGPKFFGPPSGKRSRF